jgi:hypothetical protein
VGLGVLPVVTVGFVHNKTTEEKVMSDGMTLIITLVLIAHILR